MTTNPSVALDSGLKYVKLDRYNIVVVIPAFNEAEHVETVLRSLPAFLRQIIVVDDASTDETADRVEDIASHDPRVMLIRHERNQGVGGAMATGMKKALELGAQIVVKMDADGQMSPDELPDLLWPLVSGEADYTKGNRFRDVDALRSMPALRRIGNLILSFFTKAATGYWHCFDPCNGFVAIRSDVLVKIPLRSIQRSYFFETSMLAELYLLGAVLRDVPIPARYGDESSHMSIPSVIGEFPPRLLGCFIRRLWLKNLFYDFSMESVYLLTGTPLLLCGILYGGLNWNYYRHEGYGAPTGTVVISALMLILGFQLLLSAVNEDLRNVPEKPLCLGPLRESCGEIDTPGA